VPPRWRRWQPAPVDESSARRHPYQNFQQLYDFTDVTLQEIFGAVWPFIILQLIGLALVLTFPGIALWLPDLE